MTSERHRLKKEDWSGLISEMKSRDEFLLCACDFSLNRPGFALLRADVRDQKAEVLSTCVVDNKTKARDMSKPRGEKLREIGEKLLEYGKDADVFVRERGLSRFNAEVQALFTVVGVSDYLAYTRLRESRFAELAPASVKKWITGKGTATKEEVAARLNIYVGKREYEFDDESDAVAVGVAWLIQNGFLPQEEQGGKEDAGHTG